MKLKNPLAGGGAIAALALLPASGALAGTAPVTVRVEGAKTELLATTKVDVHAGSLTRFGAPGGKCPDHSAAGALDAATHHNWKGIWESSFDDYEVTSILGETHTFSSKRDYWEIFVNGVAAQTGACEIALKPGEQLIFAAVPQKGAMEVPLVLSAPRRVRVGVPFAVQVRARSRGRIVGVEGAEVSGGGLSARTDGQGTARLTPTRAGALKLEAAKPHFVRDEITITAS